VQSGENLAVLGLARGIGIDPVDQRLLLLLPSRQGAALQQAFEHPLLIGEAIVESTHARRRLDGEVAVVMVMVSSNAICSSARRMDKGIPNRSSPSLR
jgi:hypothetical protein